MDYKGREKQVCDGCDLRKHCGYLPRGLQHKCETVSDRMEGWEMGFADCIDEVCKYLRKIPCDDGFIKALEDAVREKS